MAKPRTELQTILENLLGSTNVYFQPPPSVRMNYPAIVYQRLDGNSQFADDHAYIFKKRYQITVISRDPDEEAVDKVAMLPLCLFSRHFTIENLNHDVFNLYF